MFKSFCIMLKIKSKTVLKIKLIMTYPLKLDAAIYTILLTLINQFKWCNIRSNDSVIWQQKEIYWQSFFFVTNVTMSLFYSNSIANVRLFFWNLWKNHTILIYINIREKQNKLRTINTTEIRFSWFIARDPIKKNQQNSNVIY